MKKTTVTKKDHIRREWFLIDATGIRLGQLASFISKILQGKNKAIYAPNIDCGDYVIVTNSKSIDVHPKRYENKIYWRHSGYPGGLKRMTLGEMMKRKPNNIIKKAVWGMMPKTKLGRVMFKKLHIYEDEKHKHESCKPKLIKI